MTSPLPGTWTGMQTLPIRRYTCGFCGHETGTQLGYFCHDTKKPGGFNADAAGYVCGSCNRPTLFLGTQVPPPKLGASVPNVPPGGVAELYNEVRAATGAGAYTAAVTVARTLLAQIAVDRGAAVGLTFLAYVNWLEDEGYTTKPMKGWVDHVREQANVSAHELALMTQQEATRSLKFVEMLLRVVYEYPAEVPTKTP